MTIDSKKNRHRDENSFEPDPARMKEIRQNILSYYDYITRQRKRKRAKVRQRCHSLLCISLIVLIVAIAFRGAYLKNWERKSK